MINPTLDIYESDPFLKLVDVDLTRFPGLKLHMDEFLVVKNLQEIDG